MLDQKYLKNDALDACSKSYFFYIKLIYVSQRWFNKKKTFTGIQFLKSIFNSVLLKFALLSWQQNLFVMCMVEIKV